MSSSAEVPALVSIPGVAAYHLLGEEQLHLISNAELSIVEVKGSSTTPPLTLRLGDSLAFPLDAETVVGTQTGNEQIYLLRPHLPNVQGPQGWIKIELPASVQDVNSDVGRARDLFEDILVKHGFLYGTNIRAGGDEIAAGMKEAAATGEDKIHDAVETFKANNAPTDAPLSFSRNTHARASQVSSITGQVADLAKTATTAIGNLSHAAGASIARAFSLGERPEDEKSEARQTAETAAQAAKDVKDGAVESTSRIAASAATGIKEAVAHSQGEETAALAGHATSTAGSVAQSVGAGVVGVSAVYHGAEATGGAVEVDLKEQEAHRKASAGGVIQ